jgi:single-stranded DNA-binding protein
MKIQADFSAQNKCDFVGYIADDLELQKSETGTNFLAFNMDVIKFFKRKDGNPGKEKVQIPCEIWDTAAEFLAQKAQKGSRMWITSTLRKNGDKFVFRVNQFKMSRPKEEDAS